MHWITQTYLINLWRASCWSWRAFLYSTVSRISTELRGRIGMDLQVHHIILHHIYALFLCIKQCGCGIILSCGSWAWSTQEQLLVDIWSSLLVCNIPIFLHSWVKENGGELLAFWKQGCSSCWIAVLVAQVKYKDQHLILDPFFPCLSFGRHRREKKNSHFGFVKIRLREG